MSTTIDQLHAKAGMLSTILDAHCVTHAEIAAEADTRTLAHQVVEAIQAGEGRNMLLAGIASAAETNMPVHVFLREIERALQRGAGSPLQKSETPLAGGVIAEERAETDAAIIHSTDAGCKQASPLREIMMNPAAQAAIMVVAEQFLEAARADGLSQDDLISVIGLVAKAGQGMK